MRSFCGVIVRNIKYGAAVLLVLGGVFLPLVPAYAATGVPRIINYQGRLMDSSGVLLGGTGTDYCFKFSLYDNSTVGSGAKLWPATSPSTTTASVKNGVFSVGVGDTNVGGDVLDFNFQDTDTIYLQVDVATKVGATCAFGDGGEVFETLSPRQRVLSSGYAINAGTVGGFLAAQYASGNQIPALASGHLILGGTNPFLNATTTNTLTLQGGGQVTGDIQFFSSANKITQAGNATFAGNVTAASSTIANATSTTFFATLGRFTSAIIDTLSATVATIINLTATNFIATNATTTNATTTNLFASAFTSLSGIFGNVSATTSASLASTTAEGRFITGNFIATSTATSTINGPLQMGFASSSYLVSIVGSTTAATSATGTAVFAVSNSNPTLSSGSNILRLNQRVGFGTTCTSASTCPRFIEYFAGVPSGSDTGGRGVGSLRLSTAGTGITQTSGAADFAEYMVLNSAASVGDIVSLNSSGEYQKAVAGQSLIGVVSDNPAFVGNAGLEGTANAYVVGFAGVIETTVSDANGAVGAGDFIAASTTAGVGVKLLESGYTLGQALEAWSGPGTGQISVLVFPKYIDAAIALESYGGGGGGDSGYFSLATSTGVVTLASSTYSLSLTNKLDLQNASATQISTTYASSTQGFFGSLSVGNLTGVLRAAAGTVTTGLVNLATEITGILGVGNGGTGWSQVASGAILFGNGAGSLATTSTATAGYVLSYQNGVPTWTATTTFSTGLSYASGVVTNTGVTSIAGTANQVSVSGGTGAVTVSLPTLLALTNASSSAVSALDYVAVGRTATTTIRGDVNATSTFAGAISMTRASTTATSTLAGIQLSNIQNCTRALETDAVGNVICGTDVGVDGVTVTTFTTDGTWTKSNYTGLTFTQIITTGEGGGGGGADNFDTTNEAAAGGGGAGGTSIEMIAVASLGTTESVTVGKDAGLGGAGTGGVGTEGENSTFGAHNTGNGGGPGGGTGNTQNSACAANGAVGSTGVGSVASGGDVNVTGGSASAANCAGEVPQGGTGGASYWGSGGEGGISTGANSVVGSAGAAYGSGGGGAASSDTTTGAAGGNGADGVIVTMNYTSSSGDLAEWYETKNGVEAGDVVAISRDFYEYDSRLGLQKSSILEKANKSETVVGVVASAPNTTIGADILGKATHPSAIALAGRVPVKVSRENGQVLAGDLVTLSSVSGVAMRSTKAGVTIGRALEDDLCDASDTASSTVETSDEEKQCTVLIMVNTSYTTGALLSVALRGTGMDLEAISTDLDVGRLVLAEMLQQKKNITASTTISEVSTDRIAAGLEIITPRVIADRFVANVIEAVEKDVSIVLEEDGSFVIGKASEDDMSVSFGNASSTFETSVSIDALGNAVFAGQLKAMNIEIGSTDKPGGLTMYDAESGEPYCTRVVFGTLETIEGACASTPYIPLTLDSTPPPIPPLPPEEPEGDVEAENTDEGTGDGEGEVAAEETGETNEGGEGSDNTETAREPAPETVTQEPVGETPVTQESPQEPQAQASEVPTT